MANLLNITTTELHARQALPLACVLEGRYLDKNSIANRASNPSSIGAKSLLAMKSQQPRGCWLNQVTFIVSLPSSATKVDAGPNLKTWAESGWGL